MEDDACQVREGDNRLLSILSGFFRGVCCKGVERVFGSLVLRCGVRGSVSVSVRTYSMIIAYGRMALVQDLLFFPTGF